MAPHSQRNQQSKSDRQVNINFIRFIKNIVLYIYFQKKYSDIETFDGKKTPRKNQQVTK